MGCTKRKPEGYRPEEREGAQGQKECTPGELGGKQEEPGGKQEEPGRKQGAPGGKQGALGEKPEEQEGRDKMA